MIGRTFDLEMYGILTIEALNEDSETTEPLQTARLAAQDDAVRTARNNRGIER